MGNIILVGMMGSGKTTVGRVLAHLTGRNFIDTDYLIEKKEGMSISDIMKMRGEDYFRQIEKDAVLSLMPGQPSVISTGGGAVLDNDIFLFLKGMGTTVYLKASAAVLYKRTANVDVRPLLREGDRLRIIQELLQKRESRYLESDVIIDSDNAAPQEIAETIIMKVRA